MSAPEEAAGEHLSKTSLRDFGPPIPHEERDYDLPAHRVTLLPQEAPIPVLLRYALTLIGIRHHGPGEKVAWWVAFTYKGYPCELAHQKFGLRLRIGGDLTEDQAEGFQPAIQGAMLVINDAMKLYHRRSISRAEQR
ncbi:MAG: hypothetical protein WBW75_22310 [Mycobacterium sp.]|uniref:hypothetical protein n=1 Tax=Mycobacterium sp. TaxID=1785 RepID=UPI003C6075AB